MMTDKSLMTVSVHGRASTSVYATTCPVFFFFFFFARKKLKTIFFAKVAHDGPASVDNKKRDVSRVCFIVKH